MMKNLNFISALYFIAIAGCQSKAPIFSGDNAFNYLVKQCDFGPRNPGSEGYFKCRDFMIAELKKTTDIVITQNFTYTDEKESNLYELQNIIETNHAISITTFDKFAIYNPRLEAY